MRARNPSSTSFSRFMGGWSFATGFGGSPKLGRGRPIVELCLLRPLAAAGLVDAPSPVETLALLAGRPWELTE